MRKREQPAPDYGACPKCGDGHSRIFWSDFSNKLYARCARCGHDRRVRALDEREDSPGEAQAKARAEADLWLDKNFGEKA